MKANNTQGTKKGPKKIIPRRRLEPSLAAARAAVSNGKGMIPDIDNRSAWARRLRDLVNDSVSDLGGYEMVSNAELILIRRAAMLALQLELIESGWAQNGGEASPTQLDSYQRATGALRRLLESLGLQRRARDVTPTDPLTYAREYDRRAEDADEVVG
jgi:hypothetical protein